MHQPRTIRYQVVEVSVSRNVEPQSRIRPSQMLPWGDPYIAQLVSNLQQEVRDSHRESPRSSRTANHNPVTPVAPAEPAFEIDTDRLASFR